MGINIHAGVSYLYMRYHSYREFQGKSCLMLGVQSIDSDGFGVLLTAQKVGFELFPEAYELTRRQMKNDFDSYRFFKWLGFDEVKAMDYSDYEGADILKDLNTPITPEEVGKYDVIYNGGTLEHVYNVHQAMINIGSLLKDGGIVIHDVPGHGYSNHGFYMFSPTFFEDYYKANMYQIEELYLFNHIEGKMSSEYRSIDCRVSDPRCFLSDRIHGSSEVSVLTCVAIKNSESKDGNIPIQGMYSDAYADSLKLKQTVDIIKGKYSKVAVYGTGTTACGLYDSLKDKVEQVLLVNGVGGNALSAQYTVVDMETALKGTDCIVIGSFRYADEIENRIKDECIDKNVDLINMLDV